MGWRAVLRNATDFATAAHGLRHAVHLICPHVPPQVVQPHEVDLSFAFLTSPRGPDSYHATTEAERAILDNLRVSVVGAAGTLSFHARLAIQARRFKDSILPGLVSAEISAERTANRMLADASRVFGKEIDELTLLRGLCDDGSTSPIDFVRSLTPTPFVRSLEEAAVRATYPGHVFVAMGESSREEHIPLSEYFGQFSNSLTGGSLLNVAAMQASLRAAIEELDRRIAALRGESDAAQSQIDRLAEQGATGPEAGGLNTLVHPYLTARDVNRGRADVFMVERGHYAMLGDLLPPI